MLGICSSFRSTFKSNDFVSQNADSTDQHSMSSTTAYHFSALWRGSHPVLDRHPLRQRPLRDTCGHPDQHHFRGGVKPGQRQGSVRPPCHCAGSTAAHPRSREGCLPQWGCRLPRAQWQALRGNHLGLRLQLRTVAHGDHNMEDGRSTRHHRLRCNKCNGSEKVMPLF